MVENTSSISVNFSKYCLGGGLDKEDYTSNFATVMEIDDKSPGQFTEPCPPTIVHYYSTLQSGIEHGMYGSGEILSAQGWIVEPHTEDVAVSADGLGETVLPFFQIHSIHFEGLNFENCKNSSPYNIPQVIGRIVHAPSPGIARIVGTISYMKFEVTWPNTEAVVGTSLLQVCQNAELTSLALDYDFCDTPVEPFNLCCQSVFSFGGALAPKIEFAQDSYSAGAGNSIPLVLSNEGCSPYTWRISGEDLTLIPEKGSDGRYTVPRATLAIGSNACGSGVVTVTDICGQTAETGVKITSCCGELILSVENVLDLAPGQTRTISVLNGRPPFYPTVVQGSVTATAVASDDNRIYVTAPADATPGPIEIQVLDDCNSSPGYSVGNVVTS